MQNKNNTRQDGLETELGKVLQVIVIRVPDNAKMK